MTEATRKFTVLMGGLALIVGAVWHVGVLPLDRALAAERATLVSVHEEIETGRRHSDPERTERVLAEIERHAERFREQWARSGEPPVLYELIQDHAVRAGVRIDHIEPRRGTLTSDITTQLRNLKTSAARNTYSIDVRGDFASIREFLRAIQGDDLLARVDSFRISPSPNGPAADTLVASIGVSYYAIGGVFEEPGKEARP